MTKRLTAVIVAVFRLVCDLVSRIVSGLIGAGTLAPPPRAAARRRPSWPWRVDLRGRR